MKKLTFLFVVMMLSLTTFAQVQLDKPLQFTGSGTDAKIEGIKSVTQNQDAANKIYVDTAITNRVNGSETKINAGTNVTITGNGTISTPYIINASSGSSTSTWNTYAINCTTQINTSSNGIQTNPPSCGTGLTGTGYFTEIGDMVYVTGKVNLRNPCRGFGNQNYQLVNMECSLPVNPSNINHLINGGFYFDNFSTSPCCPTVSNPVKVVLTAGNRIRFDLANQNGQIIRWPNDQNSTMDLNFSIIYKK